jgi:integrase
MFLQKPVLGDRHSEAVTELHLTVPSVPEDYWRIQMANKVATLVRNANLEGVGWRRGTLIQSKNGRIKDGFMLYNGVEYPAPNGTYQIRHYVGSKAAYVTVGNDLDAALVMLERLNATRAKEAAEITLGIAPAPMPEEDRKTVAVLASDYIAKKKSPSQGLTRTSTRLYENTLNAFVSHVKRQYVADVTETDVTSFIDSLIQKGYAQKSRAMRYTVVRGFLRNSGVVIEKLIEPAVHKRLSSKPDADTEPYTKAQLEKLFEACTPYYKMVFTLLLHTGMRFREASHLTWQNIKWDEGKIFVPGDQRVTNRGKVKEFQTKSRKGRKIPMYPSLRVALQVWREQNPNSIYVVGSMRGDQPSNHWLQYLKKFARKAGLNCGVCDSCAEKGECEQFYLHKFRHTYAHRCLDNGIDIYEVSRNMGHHDISITIIYLQGRTSNTAKDPFSDAA